LTDAERPADAHAAAEATAGDGNAVAEAAGGDGNAASPRLTTSKTALPDVLHPRHLAVRVVEIAGLIALVVLAIGALPGLDEVRARLQNADSGWVVVLVACEVGSCLGYMLVFRSTFCSNMSWRLSYDISMAELAANSLLPAGGAGGLALGVWALRQAGMPSGHIARRTVAFFVVTSAANFLTLVIVGVGVFVDILPGSGSWGLTIVPALITALGALLVGISPRLLRALERRSARLEREGWRRRVFRALRSMLTAGADGVDQAILLLRGHRIGAVIGSLAYMAFDIAALGFAFAAVGTVPVFGTLILGYLIGQLGNLIPLPGGVGGTEGALIGVFALYGVSLTEATAAVLLYRLFELIIPALLGAPAFVLLRRKLMRAEQPALLCEPLALDVVELPSRT
jgi:uncharacterized protein (TIRG00374 family)